MNGCFVCSSFSARPGVQDIARRGDEDFTAAFIGDLNDHISALVCAFASVDKGVELKRARVFTALPSRGKSGIVERLFAFRPVLKMQLGKEESGQRRTDRFFP